MLVSAAKLGDAVIGVDAHSVLSPVGVPVPMTPHPYIGAVGIWLTPQFPSINVMINGMPAVAVGGLGYSLHIPFGPPVPPTMCNLPFWRRALTYVAMPLLLVAFTMVANVAIAALARAVVPPDSAAGRFIQDVTGIDTTNWQSAWDSVAASFSGYLNWQTWVQMLMPPLPFPGDQGSVAIGSPNVSVNGAPVAFSGPYVGASCSEIPVVPNAGVLGFSNVMVGISEEAMLRAVAVSMAQGGIQEGAGHLAGRMSGGCRP